MEAFFIYHQLNFTIITIFYSMSQEVPIDMTLLRNKIVEGITQIHKHINQKEAVLFIGDTGVGKSTLLNYLIGQELRIEQVGLKPCLVNTNTIKERAIKIGHEKYSETSVPTRIIFQGMAFYDCPGFNDNKSQQAEIANSFYYQRLMSLYDRTKLVIVVDQSYITQSRAHRFPSLVKKFKTAFGTLDKVRYSTLLVVNKCDPDSTLQDVEKQLKKLISTKDMFSEEQVQWIEFLMRNNQVFSFKQPKRSQIGKTISQDQRIQLFNKIGELDYMDKIDIKNIISDVAKLAIRDYLDVITDKSAKNVQSLMEKIRNTVLSAKTGLYQIKQQIMRIFEYKQRMYEFSDFGPLYDFCVQRKLQCQETQQFKSDNQIVEFFSKVYNKQKTQSYYLNTVSLILTNFSMLLQKVDTMIQNQKLQAERKKRKEQMRLEHERLNAMEQQNKQNKIPKIIPIVKVTKNQVPFMEKTILKSQNENLGYNFKQNQSKRVEIMQPKSSEPVILAFHRKLMNAELKVKQLTYEITDIHSKASSFSSAIDRLQN